MDQAVPFRNPPDVRRVSVAVGRYGFGRPRTSRGRRGRGSMSAMPTRRDDPYAVETTRQLGERAPAGLLFFGFCVVLSSIFDIARFPEREFWMLTFAAVFLALAALCFALVRRYPERSVPILIVVVNLIGMGLNAYHAIVGAAVAMCLWTLTGLICSSAVFLRWGRVNQAL